MGWMGIVCICEDIGGICIGEVLNCSGGAGGGIGRGVVVVRGMDGWWAEIADTCKRRTRDSLRRCSDYSVCGFAGADARGRGGRDARGRGGRGARGRGARGYASKLHLIDRDASKQRPARNISTTASAPPPPPPPPRPSLSQSHACESQPDPSPFKAGATNRRN